MSNTVLSRFEGCTDINAIRDTITVNPPPVAGLNLLDKFIAGEVFRTALKKIFVPTQFTLEFIQEMVGRSELYCRRMFGSNQSYQTNLYSEIGDEVMPICLTGLAGIGKSQTIAALFKVMPQPTDLCSDHFVEPVPIISHWFASARDKAGGKQLLMDFLDISIAKKLNQDKLLVECRKRANKLAVALVTLDEIQYMSTGDGAAKLTEVLLILAKLGLPMIYVSNYSSGHKLMGRNSEDRHRLLTNPRLMPSDAPEDAAWQEYVNECVRVSNGLLDNIESRQLAYELWRLSFGVKRLAVQILELAYVEARSARRSGITINDLDQAYVSTAYTASRQEVEELNLIAAGQKSPRKDLVCPFELPPQARTNVVSISAERDHRVQTTVLNSVMTKEEKEAVEALRDEIPGLARTPPKPKRQPPISKPSAEELAQKHLQFKLPAEPRTPRK